MLIMLKEDVGGEICDRTINPNQVADIKVLQENRCQLELIGGNKIVVVGTIQEITKRLNGSSRLLKG